MRTPKFVGQERDDVVHVALSALLELLDVRGALLWGGRLGMSK